MKGKYQNLRVILIKLCIVTSVAISGPCGLKCVAGVLVVILNQNSSKQTIIAALCNLGAMLLGLKKAQGPSRML